MTVPGGAPGGGPPLPAGVDVGALPLVRLRERRDRLRTDVDQLASWHDLLAAGLAVLESEQPTSPDAADRLTRLRAAETVVARHRHHLEALLADATAELVARYRANPDMVLSDR